MTARSTVRGVAAPVAKPLAHAAVRLRTARWPDHSRLFAVGDAGGWSVDEDATHVLAAATRLGHAVAPGSWARFAARQAVFVTSHFEALSDRWLDSSHRLGTAYLHGRPGTPDAPEFDDAFGRLRRRPDRITRVQVTHAEMQELVIAAGVPEDRVFRIPIGIDLESFDVVDGPRRERSRDELGLPRGAFVVGSFQKDGVGWGDGDVPKLVKGPDVLLAALERLREQVPELHVLLTGPARGYVRRGLERLAIPRTHVLAGSRADLARAYHALDVYLVTSRQEGGPKAVLEAMAAGVPLVSTRVGQAQELVVDGVNGLLCDVEDAEAIASTAARVASGGAWHEALVRAGRATAENYAHERLDPLWQKLFDGFLDLPGTSGGKPLRSRT